VNTRADWSGETVAAAALQPATLRRAIGRFQYFALAFGAIIGSAWVVVLGDWLRIAGPGGAALAFLAGAVFMGFIAAVYAELSVRMPEAGCEFIFAHKLFGPRVGFLVGWFVTLYLIAVTAFEAIALPWMLQALLPALTGPVLYSLFGQDITAGALLAGALGVVLITWINYRDVRIAVRVHSVVTYGFLAVTLIALAAAFWRGDAANLVPLLSDLGEAPWWLGAMWIFANTAFFLNGFQAIPQMVEERAAGVGVRVLARMMVRSVLFAAMFYIAVIVCASMTGPWTDLVGSELATAVAMRDVLPGGALAKVILLAAALSLLKTWNAMAMMAARMIMAQARAGLAPPRFARVHEVHATPGAAVLFVGVCSLAGMLLGKGAVLPLVNMASICLAFTFVLACAGLMRLRMRERFSANRCAEFRAPGGKAALVIGIIGSACMSLIALCEPLTRAQAIVPLEWTLILVWAALGYVFFNLRKHCTVEASS